MTKIKIGIIGYGSWVKDAYIPALQRDDRAQIVGISARSDATIQSIRKDFGNRIEVYKGYEALLVSTKIEAVMIAVPDSVHAEAITAALASGKAVFYEPPIAHTRELIPKIIKKLLAAPQNYTCGFGACSCPCRYQSFSTDRKTSCRQCPNSKYSIAV